MAERRVAVFAAAASTSFTASPALIPTEDSILSYLVAIRSGKLAALSNECTQFGNKPKGTKGTSRDFVLRISVLGVQSYVSRHDHCPSIILSRLFHGGSRP